MSRSAGTLACTWMVIGINVGSNLAGFFLVQLLYRYAHPVPQWREMISALEWEVAFVLLAFIVPVAVLVLHRLAAPVNQAINALRGGEGLSAQSLERAKRRALNLPFFAALMNLIAWIIPAVAFPVIFYFRAPVPVVKALAGMVYNFTNAIMITLLAFVLLEQACRRRIIPQLFPEGRLSDQKKAAALTIRTRLMLLYGAICLIPMFQTVLITNVATPQALSNADLRAVLVNIGTFSMILFAFTASYGFWLATLFARNLSDPAREIMDATEKIRAGDNNITVQVVSNDEIGYLGDRVNEMAKGLKERERIRKLLNLFTSPEISREILSGRTFEGAQIRRVTLLFSDMRGFSGMAERLPPELVFDAVNSYFDEMTAAVIEHGGIILQYVGDEIEAVFGAPLDDPQHADKAVAAALAMRERLAKLNEKRAGRGEETLRHGIGIHTGTALAGLVGSRHKLSYAMVGDTVNIASRIQDLTKELKTEILISGKTHQALTIPRSCEGPLTLPVKGKTKTVEVFRLNE